MVLNSAQNAARSKQATRQAPNALAPPHMQNGGGSRRKKAKKIECFRWPVTICCGGGCVMFVVVMYYYRISVSILRLPPFFGFSPDFPSVASCARSSSSSFPSSPTHPTNNPTHAAACCFPLPLPLLPLLMVSRLRRRRVTSTFALQKLRQGTSASLLLPVPPSCPNQSTAAVGSSTVMTASMMGSGGVGRCMVGASTHLVAHYRAAP